MEDAVKQNERSANPVAVTLFDVAHMAGVSGITVSRVVNGSIGVNDAMRTKVMAAIAALKYRVNLRVRRALAQCKRRPSLVIQAPLTSALFWSTPWISAGRAGLSCFWSSSLCCTTFGSPWRLRQICSTSSATAARAMSPIGWWMVVSSGFTVVATGVSWRRAWLAHSAKTGAPGRISFDLKGYQALRFKATISSDYSTADAETERRVFSSRTSGKEARFLTLIEPFEKLATIRSARVSGPATLPVELMDGRVHDFSMSNLTGSGKDIAVRIIETLGGKTLRQEATGALK